MVAVTVLLLIAVLMSMVEPRMIEQDGVAYIALLRFPRHVGDDGTLKPVSSDHALWD